jgi:hypothetical protein
VARLSAQQWVQRSAPQLTRLSVLSVQWLVQRLAPLLVQWLAPA